jgi:NADPH:quinone reductase-like Zn-dependent oxidoreductase
MLRPSFLGGGNRDFSFLTVKNRAEDFRMLSKWLEEGRINPVIDKKYPFEEAPQAIQRLRTGHVKGKVIVHVTERDSDEDKSGGVLCFA